MVSNVHYSTSVNKIVLLRTSLVGLVFILDHWFLYYDSQRLFTNKVIQKVNLQKTSIPLSSF